MALFLCTGLRYVAVPWMDGIPQGGTDGDAVMF